MNPISFKNWFGLVDNIIEFNGIDPTSTIHSISIDTRTLKPGDVYFALKGDRFDGHDFVKMAFEKGASASVVNKNWIDDSLSEQNAIIWVEETLIALQTLAKNYRSTFKIPVLGITGTNGKTTTKEMIAAVLSNKFRTVKTTGNLNNHIGLPLSLLNIEDKSEVAVIEMGANHIGEIKNLCEIATPTHGLITNIGAGHLEFFGSIENVAKAKGELFENLNEDDVAFVNVDDERVVRIAKNVKSQFRFGFNGNSDVKAEFLGLNDSNCARIRLEDEMEIQLKVPGKHQIYNALAAAAVGTYWNIPLEDIANTISNYTSFSKRMEQFIFQKSLILLDAYNSNPDSLKPALESLHFLAKKRNGRAVAVLGDMLELGNLSEISHENAGIWASENEVEALFLFGDFAPFYKKGFTNSGGNITQIYSNKSVLAKGLFEFLKEDDVILIKGSRGMAMETVWLDLKQMADN